MHRIFDEVHQNLLHLRGINRRGGQLARQPGLHGEAAIVEFRPQQFERFFHHGIKRSHFQLQRLSLIHIFKPMNTVILPTHTPALFDAAVKRATELLLSLIHI